MNCLKIAIDASRATVARKTGTEYYALQIIRHLIEYNDSRESGHQLRLYFRDTPAPGLFPSSANVTCHVIPFARMWTHLRFAAAIWLDQPDVTFVPAHTLPLVMPGRAAVTAHDLGFKYFPETHPFWQRQYLDWSTYFSARRATIILADSQATANDLMRFYGIELEKIRVVCPGVEPLANCQIDNVRGKYGLPERYFLFLGTLQPRKNIPRIVKAFAQWKSANPEEQTGLVLAGDRGWLYDASWEQETGDIVVTGYVDENDKGALLSHAIALIFPSLYEGFGFPVIEAMHCGTPVIASNTSSLPELVGDAGLLVNPLDIEAIAGAMGRIAADNRLRAELIQKGKQRARKFVWRNAAEQTLQLLEEAAGK